MSSVPSLVRYENFFIGQVLSQTRYLTLADNGDLTILTDSVDVDLYIDNGNGKEITSEFHAQARIAS